MPYPYFRANMEWSRVAINRNDDMDENDKDIPIATAGLDSNAHISHQRFMSDIPHLDEVMKMHEKSLEGGTSVGINSDINPSTRSFEEAVSILGVISIENGLEIPLPSSSKEGVILEKISIGNGEVIRLIAPEEFGGILETFTLPLGSKIGGARWNGDSLRINYEF